MSHDFNVTMAVKGIIAAHGRLTACSQKRSGSRAVARTGVERLGRVPVRRVLQSVPDRRLSRSRSSSRRSPTFSPSSSVRSPPFFTLPRYIPTKMWGQHVLPRSQHVKPPTKTPSKKILFDIKRSPHKI